MWLVDSQMLVIGLVDTVAMLWIQIHWIWIRFRIKGYVINFVENTMSNNFTVKQQFRFQKFQLKENNGRVGTRSSSSRLSKSLKSECNTGKWWNVCPKSYTFCLYFILYFHVWIHKAPEYGSRSTTQADSEPTWSHISACFSCSQSCWWPMMLPGLHKNKTEFSTRNLYCNITDTRMQLPTLNQMYADPDLSFRFGSASLIVLVRYDSSTGTGTVVPILSIPCKGCFFRYTWNRVRDPGIKPNFAAARI